MATGSNSGESTHGEGEAADSVFFSKPILNSPYEYPIRHWELDALGQPTQKIVETRRRAASWPEARLRAAHHPENSLRGWDGRR